MTERGRSGIVRHGAAHQRFCAQTLAAPGSRLAYGTFMTSLAARVTKRLSSRRLWMRLIAAPCLPALADCSGDVLECRGIAAALAHRHRQRES